MTLNAQRVSWRRGGALVVDDVSLEPQEGETIGLLGPNGSGKSSLLRLLQAVSRPDSGVVSLDGADISAVGRRAVARRIAAVTQHVDTDTDITVHDVVRLGRTPHRTLFGFASGDDERVIAESLDRVGLTDKADRLWTALSGGERQRAHIARALAQQPRELLLDEPTNHLDIRHQLDLLDLISGLEVTSIIALHDLNLAAMFCDRVVVLDTGRAVAAGRPAEVLTSDLIREVYEVDAEVVPDPSTGRVRITFIVPGRAPAGERTRKDAIV
ncbi:iron complex transport system ATP-binding protein [Brevibacterium sanguinis]|uniref:Iron complex transport system ATP-binding protein n=2 Tax=Brevibacterium TaxID=1696 RepID=A0A366IHW8_9MICO|nr:MULTISPECIES: ABC transporter ATP-binding protein [Brevibacterium]RBP64256.1 iron complex transport system ATP-binding protein [Brevibacterium sanguinis]RBP71452.1 iron complex transport system ATP-binding protein [Brevibacterium celere]